MHCTYTCYQTVSHISITKSVSTLFQADTSTVVYRDCTNTESWSKQPLHITVKKCRRACVLIAVQTNQAAVLVGLVRSMTSTAAGRKVMRGVASGKG